jgi:CHAT domain-containing protein
MTKRIFFVSIFVLFKCFAFAQINLNEIYSQFDYYCDQGLYTNASNLLVEKGIECMVQGDTLAAYELQKKNCLFTDEHIEDFFQNGLTWEGYFANWYVTISLAAWLNRREEIAPTYLKILVLVSQKEPKLLPLFASTLGYVLYYRMPSNLDSMEFFQKTLFRILQKPLDFIKTVVPTKELVKQFNEITESFYNNRFLNSFDKNDLVNNHFDELQKWYSHNHRYIEQLDSSLYYQEILEYELLFVDEIVLYAATFATEKERYYNAIEMYSEAVSILKPYSENNIEITHRIVTYYAQMAQVYSLLGDMVLSKEYSDKTLPYLLNHQEEFEDFNYCEILNNLSFSYFHSNNYEVASQLKLAEIYTRYNLGFCTLTDWATYFMFVLDSDPKKIIEYKDVAIKHANNEEYGCVSFYYKIGEAFSYLMGPDNYYRDSSEMYFNIADRILASNTKNYRQDDYYLHYKAWAGHYLRLGQLQKAYDCYKEALLYPSESVDYEQYEPYRNLVVLSSYMHKMEDAHVYFSKYYKGLETDLCEMLPILGSTESDMYLGNGGGEVYRISEWASWNPTDSLCVSIAYDAALLIKGLTLRYNVLSPYFETHPEMEKAKRELDRMRDSVYSILDDNERLLALHRYQLKEREMLKEVNNELTNVHWGDVARGMKENEACVEFVKYTANAYSWCDGEPTPHYAAMVLLSNASVPIFVDLFDEAEILEVYELQPKSYDIEIGQSLYHKIWARLDQYIKGKNKVFFSPMGLLNLINIELLTNADGRTAAENYNLYRVSSTKKVLSRNENGNLRSLASFGGVDYKSNKDYADAMRGLNTRGNWAYLQNTLLEVNQIGDLLKDNGVDVATYTGPRATEVAFKQLDGTQTDIIHIATHGYYIPQTQRNAIPYFANSANTVSVQDELFYSGLILSGGQIAWADSTFKPDNNDGILTAYEISKLDLHNVDLVVLSACETGLGDDLFDGIFGLQRAFKKAGVSSILMSLWQIDDKITAEYMGLFYEKLSNGFSIHDAYIITVLNMKKNYPDANYWASFVLLD